ncbi:hypothetical protein HK102_000782, partial [Quaeritorhiza haematococci]
MSVSRPFAAGLGVGVGLGAISAYFLTQSKRSPLERTSTHKPTLPSQDSSNPFSKLTSEVVSPSSEATLKRTMDNTTPPPPSYRSLQLARYGLPQTEQIRFFSNFISSINYKTRQPNWVLEHLTAENLKGSATRDSITFEPDLNVPELFRARNEDYFRSGLSRGHLAPAGDNRISTEAMKETFLLNANIVPQDYQNNVWYWNRLELFVRDLTESFDNVWVLTGPLWVPRLESDERISPYKPLSPDSPSAANGTNSLTDPGKPITSVSSPKQSEKNELVAAKVPSETIPNTSHEQKAPNPADSTPHISSKVSGDPVIDNKPNESTPASVLAATPGATPQTPYKHKPRKEVRYQVIGDRDVAVPTHLFKAVLATREGVISTPANALNGMESAQSPAQGPDGEAIHTKSTQKEVDASSQQVAGPQTEFYFAAFIIPNELIPEELPLEAFQVSKSEIERHAGFTIFEDVFEQAGNQGTIGTLQAENARIKNLCKSHGCQMMSPDDHRQVLYFLARELRKAPTGEKVESVIKKLKEQGLAPDPAFMSVFLEKYNAAEREYRERLASQA